MRTLLHITVLPLLAIALMTGSQASLCETVSIFGIDAHHHSDHSPSCLGHHEHDDGDRVPCNETCESKLTEASNPQILKTPQPSLVAIVAVGFSVLDSPTADPLANSPRLSFEPPDSPANLASPSFTGRFLI